MFNGLKAINGADLVSALNDPLISASDIQHMLEVNPAASFIDNDQASYRTLISALKTVLLPLSVLSLTTLYKLSKVREFFLGVAAWNGTAGDSPFF